MAEETQRMEQHRGYGNGQATTVGGGGALTVLTKTTKKQQSSNVHRQKGSTMTAGETWGTEVEAEEQLSCVAVEE